MLKLYTVNAIRKNSASIPQLAMATSCGSGSPQCQKDSRPKRCKGDERTKSVEELVLVTEDSLAHLQTHFYVFATWGFGKSNRSLEALSEWVLKKIERDLI